MNASALKRMGVILLIAMSLLLLRPFGITFNWILYSLTLSTLLISILLLEFEERKYDARMLALISVLTALVVASRQLMHGIEFSPVFFLVMLAGYTYGFIPGFTIGAMAMFTSNFFLGQGPWTPFQMLGMGAVGGFASLLPALKDKRLELAVLAFYGVITAFLYGAFTDLFSWLAFTPQQTLETLAGIVSAGIVANTSRAAGNVLFTLILGPAVLKVLRRFRKRFTMEYIDL